MNFDGLNAEIEGIVRYFAPIENFKQQSLHKEHDFCNLTNYNLTLKEMKLLLRLFSIALATLLLIACSKETNSSTPANDNYPLRTRAVIPDDFDWENADWMPTPSGQAQIPMPWGGQGSISGFYGLDVVNDYHKQDGWRMVYYTFRDYGEELIDPYFVLYNVYRGTLRFYFFLSNPYIGESTYLQDALYLNHTTGISSNILNYLGSEIVDVSNNTAQFNQIQPKMLNGAAPLAGRRWYMMEYEMAYDPNIINCSSDQATLSWGLNYYNIDKITLDGTAKGEIYGTIGGSDNFLNDAKSTIGKGMLSVVGLGTLEKLTINEKTGENKIGLNNNAFKSIVSGVKSAISSSSAGLPGMAIGFLNSVFGGNSESSSQIVSLKSKTSISLSGNFSSLGSVSSTPIEFKIPGTVIRPNSSGYIPLYNEPLGVLYWKDGVTVQIDETVSVTIEPDEIMGTGNYRVLHHTASDRYQDYSQYVIVNPAVSKVADVSILAQSVYAVTTTAALLEFPLIGTMYDSPWESDAPIPDLAGVAIHLLLEVKPKDGSPSTYITKTFYADTYTWTTNYLN